MATFVLVHGSYQGGWIWQRVATRLRAAGHTGLCPESRRLRRAQATRSAPASPPRPRPTRSPSCCSTRICTMSCWSAPVRAAWSSCRVAEAARERIARLVFVDALALLDGEKIRDIVTRSTAMPSGLTAGPSREDAANRLFADLDPATRAWALERYTLHPIGIYEQPGEARRVLDAAVGGERDLVPPAPNPGEAHQRRSAERLEGEVVRARHRPLPDAQHARGADRAADGYRHRSLEPISDLVAVSHRQRALGMRLSIKAYHMACRRERDGGLSMLLRRRCWKVSLPSPRAWGCRG